MARLLIASTVLLFLWSFAVPVFEAPDEAAHWQYANYVRHHFRLPYYDSAFVEANQPPLYYILIAPFAADTTAPAPGAWVDSQGRLSPVDPPKIHVNSPTDFKKYWPIRISRLVTACFSIITVLFAYLTAFEATGSSSAGLLAGSLTAFLPQFTFRGMNISNDAFVAATCSICVYLVVRLVIRGFTWPLGWATGAMIGVAFLSKISAIFLPVTYAIAVLWEPAPWRQRIKRLTVLAVPVVIGLPWLVRNQLLYGDPLATRQMLVAVPSLIDSKPISSQYFIETFPAVMFRSFVGVFGGMNLYMPDVIYELFAVAGVAAFLGFIAALVRRRLDLRLAAVLVTVPLFSLALTIHLNLTFTQPQGRYLFPALTAIAVIAATGLCNLPRWNMIWTHTAVAAAVFLNLLILGGIILPTYWAGPLRPLGPDIMIRAQSMTPAGPLGAGEVYNQTFVSRQNNLSKIEILVGTYNAQIPSGTLRLQLRPNISDPTEIACWSVPLNSISDNSYVGLEFPPIADSYGRSYALIVNANGVPDGHAITVWLSDQNVYDEGQFFTGSQPHEQDAVIRTYYSP